GREPRRVAGVGFHAHLSGSFSSFGILAGSSGTSQRSSGNMWIAAGAGRRPGIPEHIGLGVSVSTHARRAPARRIRRSATGPSPRFGPVGDGGSGGRAGVRLAEPEVSGYADVLDKQVVRRHHREPDRLTWATAGPGNGVVRNRRPPPSIGRPGTALP